MFTIQLCQSKAAYKVLPTEKITLDFEAIKKNEQVELDAGSALVVLIGTIHIVVHSFGELLVRDTTDEAVIRRVAEQLYRYVL